MAPPPTLFLKLGGSLITDKSAPGTARNALLQRLAAEISEVFTTQPDMRLLIGHGSGSFGHIPAKKYGTRRGVSTSEEWRGFATVWHHAAQLNRIVVDALRKAGLPALAFPPSAACTADQGKIVDWPTAPLQAALTNGLVPVVFGDVAVDRTLGGTIVSTEDVFSFLVSTLHPARILVAGIEPGVWADFPACTRLIDEITPQSHIELKSSIQGSAHPDVTGGMDAKVLALLELVQQHPETDALIFGGMPAGAVAAALSGGSNGTRITAE